VLDTAEVSPDRLRRRQLALVALPVTKAQRIRRISLLDGDGERGRGVQPAREQDDSVIGYSFCGARATV
jgi:hypothetical protein